MPVRIVLRRPDEVASFGKTRFATDTTIVDLRVGEIAEPRPDDEIEVDGTTFVVQGEPRRDSEHLIWRIEAVPA